MKFLIIIRNKFSIGLKKKNTCNRNCHNFDFISRNYKLSSHNNWMNSFDNILLMGDSQYYKAIHFHKEKKIKMH